MKIYISICDDNIKDTLILEENINKVFNQIKEATIEIDVYHNPHNFLENFQKGLEKYNIIFLDIEMPEENGIRIARKIRDIDSDVLIIYVSSYDRYMRESFEVQPFRYILKPIKFEELRKSIFQAFHFIVNNNNLITFSLKNTTYQLRIKDIIYITVENGRKLNIITSENEYKTYGKLGDLEKHLKPYFFARVHTGYVVNMDNIRSINNVQIIMNNEDEIPISRGRRQEFKLQYHNFIELRLI
ncbi:LytR/AlgR family response regulator transcription factor [Lysinibacillus xylanilyticus]|uniref:LytR/AlgR family response regulator transcription factor n=1 Tax=Lysinibacillus xylanilyticus TaxID=582475 RepID=UPI0037FE2379